MQAHSQPSGRGVLFPPKVDLFPVFPLILFNYDVKGVGVISHGSVRFDRYAARLKSIESGAGLNCSISVETSVSHTAHWVMPPWFIGLFRFIYAGKLY